MVIALCHVLGRYELYGVVAHGGQLTSSGHYIAYIRADVTASVKSGNFLTTFTFIIFAFSALTLLVWRQEGHPACKKLRVVGYWHRVKGQCVSWELKSGLYQQ